MTRLDGHFGDVTMSVTGLPPGVVASFSKTTFGGRSFGEAKFYVRAEPGAPAADKNIAIVAKAGAIEARYTFRLRVDPAQ